MGFEFYYLDSLLKGSLKLSVLYRCECAGAVVLMAVDTARVGQDYLLEETKPCDCRTESSVICQVFTVVEINQLGLRGNFEV